MSQSQMHPSLLTLKWMTWPAHTIFVSHAVMRHALARKPENMPRKHETQNYIQNSEPPARGPAPRTGLNPEKNNFSTALQVTGHARAPRPADESDVKAGRYFMSALNS